MKHPQRCFIVDNPQQYCTFLTSQLLWSRPSTQTLGTTPFTEPLHHMYCIQASGLTFDTHGKRENPFDLRVPPSNSKLFV